MVVAYGVAIHRFGQTVSGFERFFALKVPHEHLARLRRRSSRLRREQCQEVCLGRHLRSHLLALRTDCPAEGVAQH